MVLQKVLTKVIQVLEWIALNLLTARVAGFFRAAKFVYRLGLDVYTGVDESHTVLKTAAGEMPAKVFRPKCTSIKKPLPTVVIIHGLATSGYNDERVLQLCRSIAGTGTICVAPHIHGLTTCVVSRERVHEVSSVIEAIAADSTLTAPGHRVSAVSACITAGFVLVASAQTDTINAVLCIGTHASARHVLAHCNERRGLGGSMYAIESALLTAAHKSDPELAALYHRSLQDDHLLIKDTPKAKLPIAIKESPRAGEIYTHLRADWSRVSKGIRKAYDDDVSMWEAVSPIRFVKQFKCKSVTLIHSASDGIVPPIESRLMYDSIKKQRADIVTNVKITALLDHGDKQTLGISAIPEAISLIKSLSCFFIVSHSKQNRFRIGIPTRERKFISAE